jgi:3-phenylpropionate/cinnamic acid dioxygenase small subunit
MTIFDELVAEVEGFRSRGRSLGSPATAEASHWLHLEARLLDDRRLLDWLDLCSEDVVYWIPADHEGGDPRKEVSIVLDDRSRLEDRVHWILSGKSHAQQPPSRTIRQVTNIEVWSEDETAGVATGERLTRSTLVIHELRAAEPRQIAAIVEHVWRPGSDGWRIRRKRIHLLDSDRHRWNATFVI